MSAQDMPGIKAEQRYREQRFEQLHQLASAGAPPAPWLSDQTGALLGGGTGTLGGRARSLRGPSGHPRALLRARVASLLDRLWRKRPHRGRTHAVPSSPEAARAPVPHGAAWAAEGDPRDIGVCAQCEGPVLFDPDLGRGSCPCGNTRIYIPSNEQRPAATGR